MRDVIIGCLFDNYRFNPLIGQKKTQHGKITFQQLNVRCNEHLKLSSFVLHFRPTTVVKNKAIVTHMTFGLAFNEKLTLHFIPKTTTHLNMGYAFNQPLSIGDIPNSVTHLVLSSCFNQPLKSGVIPPSVTHLTFGLYFDTQLKEGDIPQSVKYLVFGHCFNQPLHPNIIPSSVRYLEFDFMFNQMLKKGDIPENVCFFNCQFNAKQCILPKNMSILISDNSIDGDNNCINSSSINDIDGNNKLKQKTICLEACHDYKHTAEYAKKVYDMNDNEIVYEDLDSDDERDEYTDEYDRYGRSCDLACDYESALFAKNANIYVFHFNNTSVFVCKKRLHMILKYYNVLPASSLLTHELIAHVYNPDRMARMCTIYNTSFEKYAKILMKD